MKFLDFFSGIGGFHTGLENAGMKCAGWCESVNVVEYIGKHIMTVNKELEEIEKDTSNNGF